LSIPLQLIVAVLIHIGGYERGLSICVKGVYSFACAEEEQFSDALDSGNSGRDVEHPHVSGCRVQGGQAAGFPPPSPRRYAQGPARRSSLRLAGPPVIYKKLLLLVLAALQALALCSTQSSCRHSSDSTVTVEVSMQSRFGDSAGAALATFNVVASATMNNAFIAVSLPVWPTCGRSPGALTGAADKTS